MKPASGPLIALLANPARQFQYADAYTIELIGGQVLRYTTAQNTFTVTPPDEPDPVTFIAGAVLMSGLRYRLGVGTDVDEQEIVITAKPTAVVDGIPFLVAVRRGLLDGAIVKRTRYFFTRFGTPAVGGIVFFRGFVSTINDIGATTASAKVKSGMILLNIPMPRNLQQPQCLNTLYDTVCKLDRDDYAVQSVVEAASTVLQVNSADATVDYFDQGYLRFETGVNIGVVRAIRKSTGTALILIRPLEVAPDAGDEFVMFPGCDKTQNTCLGKFSNLANFRGFPFVPPPETAA